MKTQHDWLSLDKIRADTHKSFIYKDKLFVLKCLIFLRITHFYRVKKVETRGGRDRRRGIEGKKGKGRREENTDYVLYIYTSSMYDAL